MKGAYEGDREVIAGHGVGAVSGGHTPGSWDWSVETWNHADLGPREQGVVRGDEGELIVHVLNPGWPEREANLRLIAAAPDLLMVAEWCAEWLEAAEEYGYEGRPGEPNPLAHVHAAIARARSTPAQQKEDEK